MGQRGMALLDMARHGASRDIFHHKVRQGLERFAGFRDLLEHARHWVEQVVASHKSF